MMKKIMLSCFKATELVEKSNLVDLSSIEKIRLRMHISVCAACKKYQKQSLLINELLQDPSAMTKNELSDSELSTLNEAIEKIIEESKQG